MIKKLSYYIPLAQAHNKKLATPILLQAAIDGGEIAANATEFPEGTIIEITTPEVRSKKKNEIETHPIWTITFPQDDENAIEYRPSSGECQAFVLDYIALRKIQNAYFQSDKDQKLLAQSKEMESTVDRKSIDLRRRFQTGAARPAKRQANS